MISSEHALQMIQDSLNSLQQAGLIAPDVKLGEDTILLGTGSPLDSITFVTFMMEMEDRLDRETNQDLALVFDDIHAFNADNRHLSAATLAKYIVRLTGG